MNVCLIHRKLNEQTDNDFEQITETSNNLHPITVTSWEKITHAANVRRTQPNFSNSVYKQIIDELPSNLPENGHYHTVCYKNFTALPKILAVGDKKSQTCSDNQPALRNPKSSLSTSRTGVLEKVCIWCKKERRKVKWQWMPLHSAVFLDQEVKKYIQLSGDQDLIAELSHSEADFVAKEVCYHQQ